MLAHIPVWVFGIFLLLLALGYRQSRARDIAPAVAIIVALVMIGLSLSGVVSAFGLAPLALLAWAGAMFITLIPGAGALAPAGLTYQAGSGRVRVPGSWLPMCLMMGIFGVKFALGFAAGVGSAVTGDSLWAIAASFVLGLLSGAFSARALAIAKVARAARR